MPPEQRWTFIRPVLFAIALVSTIALSLFASVAVIKRTLGDAFATEQAINDAQRYAALSTSTQLDEETGVRGYVVSGRKFFLTSYYEASRRMIGTPAALSDALARAGLPEERRFVNEAHAVNAMWRAQVAGPLMLKRHRRDAQYLQVRGKSLSDRYRAALRHIERAVAVRATAETTAAALAVSRVGLLGLLGVLLIGFVIAFSLRQQTRLGRELALERRATHAMQRGLLQQSLPKLESIVLDASYVPAARESLVGGDWFDVYVRRDGRIMFSIGDVAGHGIAAAVVMSRAREAIVALGAHADDPASVLANANDVLIMQDSKMATAIFGYVDPATGSVTYASAGHPPPLIVSAAGSASFLPYGGVPLGLLHDQHYVSHSLVAERGTALFFYTDGLTEHTRDMIAGERALLAVAPALVAHGTERLATRMHRHIFGETAPRDDAAILSIAFVGPVAADRTVRKGTLAPLDSVETIS